MAGAVESAVGIAAAILTLACGLAELESAQIGGWSPRRVAIHCLWAGSAMMAISVLAALGIARLSEIDPAWGNAAIAIERPMGRLSSWLIAVPVGLAVGALLGRVNQMLDRFGREPIAAFAIGASLLAISAAWTLRELQPVGETQAARFSAFGGGFALSAAEFQSRPLAGAGDRSASNCSGWSFLAEALYVRFSHGCRWRCVWHRGAIQRSEKPISSRRFGDFELLQRTGRDGPFMLLRQAN